MSLSGLEVRFEYDDTKLQPSNISTNNIVNDVTNIKNYFKFESEFAGTSERPILEIDSDVNEAGHGNNIVRAQMSLFPPLSTMPVSEHIIEKDGSKIISTGDAVKFGEMSFRMITDDRFDINGFKLKASNKYSPATGIKVNLDVLHCFEKSDPETGVFRFTDETASKDADLANIVVSSGKVNEENPDESNYKEYNLDPIFDKEVNNYTLTLLEYLDTIDITATQSDENASMKIKVPKRDSEGNLVYEIDGTTIIYEEKNLNDEVPMEITLNKLGEPDTEITIDITAEDGATQNTYKVVIKRPYGTIKGNVKTKASVHQADIRVYSTNDVSSKIDWSTIVSGVSDTVHSTLLTLNSQDYKTQDDGTYEIYVIPGTYDILMDKKGYLDLIYLSKEVQEGETLNLGEDTLIAGDVNKDGTIELSDYTSFLSKYLLNSSDSNYMIDYDFNLDGDIELSDLTILLEGYLKNRLIK